MIKWKYTGNKVKTTFVKEWGYSYIKEKEYQCFCEKWDRFYPCMECHRHGYTKKEDLLPKKSKPVSIGRGFGTSTNIKNWILELRFIDRLDGYYASIGTEKSLN